MAPAEIIPKPAPRFFFLAIGITPTSAYANAQLLLIITAIVVTAVMPAVVVRVVVAEIEQIH